MKRIVWFALLLAACGKEDKVSPANSSTFVRYFNGGNNDVATAVIETSDKGLLIVATTEIQPNELTPPHYKIKLIRTDEAGNQQWQKFFPPFGTDGSYKAGGMFIKDDGSIAIAGSDMLSDVPRLMLLTTADSEIPDYSSKTFDKPAQANIVGTAVTVNADGDFMLLGSIPDPDLVTNTVLARLSPALDSLWSSFVGSGPVIMANKVFLDGSKTSIFLGGTTLGAATTSMKLTNLDVTPNNPGGIISNSPIGDPTYQVIGSDFCRYGNEWAFVGTTNEKRTGTGSKIGSDFDITFRRTNALNPQFDSIYATYPIDSAGATIDGAGQNEAGNSICVTKEGGLLLLGTVNSQGSFGKGGKDYYLIKIDPRGGLIWTKQYGSKFDDNGVQVLQASDGGYIVLGTTTFANLKTIMLMKTDKDGGIQ